jgi:ABC-type amino acid transport system permease subunit
MAKRKSQSTKAQSTKAPSTRSQSTRSLSGDSDEGVVLEKPRWDVYSMMLLLSLLATIVACVCLFAELRAYQWDMKAKSALSLTGQSAVSVAGEFPAAWPRATQQWDVA